MICLAASREHCILLFIQLTLQLAMTAVSIASVIKTYTGQIIEWEKITRGRHSWWENGIKDRFIFCVEKFSKPCCVFHNMLFPFFTFLKFIFLIFFLFQILIFLIFAWPVWKKAHLEHIKNSYKLVRNYPAQKRTIYLHIFHKKSKVHACIKCEILLIFRKRQAESMAW